MAKLFRVALLVESSRGYGRNLLAGIASYARLFGPWTFFHEERLLGDAMPAALKSWQPDGIIARMENRAMTRRILATKLPAIDVLRDEGVSGVPGVLTDSDAIVRVTIEHLLERRLRHFAYCGFPSVAFSDSRQRSFVKQLAARGHRVDVFSYRRDKKAKSLAEIEKDAMLHADELAAWLKYLPKPLGLMACNDMRAYQVLNVCAEHGILVPDEVAVTGVDNDPVQCELSFPSLSSIDANAQRIGYEAARLLHRLMEHRGPVPHMTRVEPLGMIARRSTDALAIADEEVVELVRYVRDRACDGITPQQIVTHAAASRSTIERMFAKHLGHTISDEIHRVKLERVKTLLGDGNLSLAEIARLCGFAYSETMQRAFKEAFGQTPGQYRSDIKRGHPGG